MQNTNGEDSAKAIITALIRECGAPALTEHIEKCGPAVWRKTARSLESLNEFLSQSIKTAAQLIQDLESDSESWAGAAIIGHTRINPIFQFSARDKADLWHNNIITVSQLFSTSIGTTLTKDFADLSALNLNPPLISKLKNLQSTLANTWRNYNEHTRNPHTTTQQIFSLSGKLSQYYARYHRKKMESKIVCPPSRTTRIRDGKNVPDVETYKKAYQICTMPMLANKTKEIAFQILNRTLWSNNKAFKSNIIDADVCFFCNETADTEHIILNCDAFSYFFWTEFERFLNIIFMHPLFEIPAENRTIRLTYRNIIYHETLNIVKTNNLSENVQQFIVIMICELKRDIYYYYVNNEQRRDIPIQRKKILLMKMLQNTATYLDLLQIKPWTTYAEIMRESVTIYNNISVD